MTSIHSMTRLTRGTRWYTTLSQWDNNDNSVYM
jgi:hypothetical protein